MQAASFVLMNVIDRDLQSPERAGSLANGNAIRHGKMKINRAL